jgi:AcrR family transcriptional regulator
VPRISADTVAQHRANRLRALLDAGRELVEEGGTQALTLAALARRVGLSRPSLYEYFRSREALIAAIVSDELPEWVHRLDLAVARAEGVPAKIEAYLRTELEIVADGRHGAVVALAAHEPLMAPLVDVLRDAGVARPQLRAVLVHGMIEAAAGTIAPDHAPHDDVVITELIDQVLHGLGMTVGQPIG